MSTHQSAPLIAILAALASWLWRQGRGAWRPGLMPAALLLAAAAAAAASPAQLPAADTELVAAANPCLNLRPAPETANEPLRCLPPGRRLTLLESRNGWGRVRLTDDDEGWVALRLARPATETEIAPVSTPPVEAPTEQRIDELERALAAAEAARQEALAESTAARGEIADLRSEVEELRRASRRLEAAEQGLEAARGRIAEGDAAAARVAELEAALATAQAELEEERSRSTELNRRTKGLLDTATERLDASVAAKEQAEKEARRRAAETSEALQEAAELRQALAAAETAGIEQERSREAADGRIAELEQALAAAEATRLEQERSREAADGRIAELEQTLATTETARDEQAQAHRTASTRIAELEQALATAETARRESLADSSALSDETEALRSEAAALREDNQRLRDEVAARQQSEAESRRWIAELNEALVALEAEPAAPESSTHRDESRLDERQDVDILREGQRQIESLSGRLRAAEMFLAESEKLRRGLTKELAALREELAARPDPGAPGGTPAGSTPPEPASPSDQAAILEMVSGWARAWSTQQVEEYLSFYAGSFVPPGGESREAWEATRRLRIRAPSRIHVGVALVDLRQTEADRAQVEFVQAYQSDRYSDSVVKTLELVLESGRWKIARETTE